MYHNHNNLSYEQRMVIIATRFALALGVTAQTLKLSNFKEKETLLCSQNFNQQ